MQRSAGLDLMRATAISLVLLDHFIGLVHVPLPWALFFKGWSWIGVDIFFALSGFLIGRILLKLDFQVSASRTLFGFWIRRWLRTLPVYYIMLFVRLLVVMGCLNLGWQAFRILPPYFAFLQCWAWPIHPFLGKNWFFGETWSLAVEEWFYLIFPLLLVGLSYSGIKPIKAFIFASFTMLVLPTILRIYIAPADPTNWITETYMVTIFRFDSIAFGLFAAVISVACAPLWARARWVSLALGLSLLWMDHQHQMLDMTMNQYWRVWHFTVTGLGSALLLPWCSSVQKLFWPTLQSLVGVIARWSYSLYLVHFMFLTLAMSVLMPHIKPSATRDWGLLLLTLCLSIIFAAFFHRWVEIPGMNLRERWKLSRETRANPVCPPITTCPPLAAQLARAVDSS
jgi:peptidoglycan/LPS O-acetylase OafA/YrhL